MCAKMVQETDSLGCHVMWVTAKPPKAKRGEVRSRKWILHCRFLEFCPLGSRKLTRGGMELASLVVNLTTSGNN